MSSDRKVLKLQVSMPLAVADRIADAALAAGRAAGLLPLAVAVLDAGGNPVVPARAHRAHVRRATFLVADDLSSLSGTLPPCESDAGSFAQFRQGSVPR